MALEALTLVLGWPSTGEVWLLRVRSGERLPRDFRRLHMGLNMDERVSSLSLIPILRRWKSPYVILRP